MTDRGQSLPRIALIMPPCARCSQVTPFINCVWLVITAAAFFAQTRFFPNSMSFCNVCRTKLLAATAFVTACSHMFCETCGQPALSRQACPVCHSSLPTKFDCVKIHTDPPEHFKTMVLAGLQPEAIMDVAGRALAFWSFQSSLRLIQLQDELTSKANELEALQHQVHSQGIVGAAESSRSQQALAASQNEVRALRAENASLQERFADKTHQLQRLQAMYDAARRQQPLAPLPPARHVPPPPKKAAPQQPPPQTAIFWFDDTDTLPEPENIAPSPPRQQFFEPEVPVLSAIEQRMKQRRGGP